ncbi:MAG: hypothetical protein ACFWT0_07140 [Bifidobacterium crudilactis]|jgi:hypothetical protein
MTQRNCSQVRQGVATYAWHPSLRSSERHLLVSNYPFHSGIPAGTHLVSNREELLGAT